MHIRGILLCSLRIGSCRHSLCCDAAEPAVHCRSIAAAHPAFERSRVNSRLKHVAEGVDGVHVHDLYEAYPDFAIDVDREQALLLAHEVITLQFPFYWYSIPPLLKEWLDLVWLHGFAYGSGGQALAGKTLQIACTTGGPSDAYRTGGSNNFTMEEFLRPLEQTAYLCGMTWSPPFVIHGSGQLSAEAIEMKAQLYAKSLERLGLRAERN